MNKKRNGLVAGIAGLSLLVGMGGTYAMWDSTGNINGGQIMSGSMELTVEGPTTWYDVSGDRASDGAEDVPTSGLFPDAEELLSGVFDTPVVPFEPPDDTGTAIDLASWVAAPGDFLVGEVVFSLETEGDNLLAYALRVEKLTEAQAGQEPAPVGPGGILMFSETDDSSEPLFDVYLIEWHGTAEQLEAALMIMMPGYAQAIIAQLPTGPFLAGASVTQAEVDALKSSLEPHGSVEIRAASPENIGDPGGGLIGGDPGGNLIGGGGTFGDLSTMRYAFLDEERRPVSFTTVVHPELGNIWAPVMRMDGPVRPTDDVDGLGPMALGEEDASKTWFDFGESPVLLASEEGGELPSGWTIQIGVFFHGTGGDLSPEAGGGGLSPLMMAGSGTAGMNLSGESGAIPGFILKAKQVRMADPANGENLQDADSRG